MFDCCHNFDTSWGRLRIPFLILYVSILHAPIYWSNIGLGLRNSHRFWVEVVGVSHPFFIKGNWIISCTGCHSNILTFRCMKLMNVGTSRMLCWATISQLAKKFSMWQNPWCGLGLTLPRTLPTFPKMLPLWWNRNPETARNITPWWGAPVLLPLILPISNWGVGRSSWLSFHTQRPSLSTSPSTSELSLLSPMWSSCEPFLLI